MLEEDVVELKFRLYDGSDIGPSRYPPVSTVAVLKKRTLTEWPKDILVWMRFMATRQLIWNKNYNVKPRVKASWSEYKSILYLACPLSFQGCCNS